MTAPRPLSDAPSIGTYAYEPNPRGNDVNIQSAPQVREYEAIADRIAADRPGSVLDWGCGWGFVSVLLRERGLSVESLDYRTDLEREGLVPLERFPEQPVYLTSEPVRLPYDDDRFDAVLSLGVLEHVQDPRASLAELHRVLKPGGTLYVYKLPNRSSYLEWVARRAGMYYHGKYEHDTIYTLRSARRIVDEAGFTVGELRYANMLPLTVTGSAADRLAGPIWGANRALGRVPGLRGLATNVELVATARR